VIAVVKKEGKYYRVYLDFVDVESSQNACKDMKARRYIINWESYES